MLSAIPLSVILDRSSVITRSKGCVELVAHYRIDCIFREEAIAESFTTCTISSSIHRICNVLAIHGLHTQFTDHAQARELVRVVFRRRFWPGPLVAKGHISIVQTLCCPFAFPFARMRGQHIAKVCRERCQNGELEYAFRRRVVDVLAERYKRSAVLREDAEALQRDHHVARPAVERVDEHQPSAPSFDILQEPAESGPPLDLFASRTTFIVLVEDRLWQITARALLHNGAFLCLD